MECPPIGSIDFSRRSLQAIDEIRRVKRSVNALSVAMSAGVIGNIFLGNGAVEASYALQDTDFRAYAKSMNQLPVILRRRIVDEADRAALDVTNFKERQFWQAVSNGCKVY